MKFPFFLCIALIAIQALAQGGMRNMGQLKVFTGAQIGFHSDLINDGIWDANDGLVGFYNDQSLHISGFFQPVFHDMEVMISNGLDLSIGIGVTNNVNFITGNIRTPRNHSFTTLDFHQDAYHNGSADVTKVDGYVYLKDKVNFIFPVGDAIFLRPLIMNAQSQVPEAICTYFLGDVPSNFYGPNYLNHKTSSLDKIGSIEFWHLEGSIPTSIQVTWNQRSQIDRLTSTIEEIVMVGFHKTRKKWENLGGSSMGNLTEGVVSSGTFIPNDYELLTFGTQLNPKNGLDSSNYLLTPNGDGINDVLQFPEIQESNNNHVQIYNREGLLVFEKENYTNEFNGYATEGMLVVNRGKGLPSGVYFYLLTLKDLKKDYQGFLYLAKN